MRFGGILPVDGFGGRDVGQLDWFWWGQSKGIRTHVRQCMISHYHEQSTYGVDRNFELGSAYLLSWKPGYPIWDIPREPMESKKGDGPPGRLLHIQEHRPSHSK